MTQAVTTKPMRLAPHAMPKTVAAREPLYEQYRPRKWVDVVGQPAAVRQISILARRGLAGRAYFLTGGSGTGKTTIARLLASEVADSLNTEELDAKRLTPARLAEFERASNSLRIGDKPGCAYLINEAHGLTSSVIHQLLTTLERIPRHVIWCFTTTREGRAKLFDEQGDAPQLLSRCQVLSLVTTDLTIQFAQLALSIADREQLGGKPIEDAIRLVTECKCNMRMVLQAVESGRLLA